MDFTRLPERRPADFTRLTEPLIDFPHGSCFNQRMRESAKTFLRIIKAVPGISKDR